MRLDINFLFSVVIVLYVYLYIIFICENIFYSYPRKIIDKQHFSYIFNNLFQYFGGVTLMSFNHLSLISSWVQILYLMYVYVLYLFRKILRYPLLINSIFPIFLIVRFGIPVSFR